MRSSTLLFSFLFVGASFGALKDLYQVQSGDGTYYVPGTDYYGACSYPKALALPKSGNGLVTNGINQPQFYDGKICGACIQVNATGAGAGANPYPATPYISFITDTDGQNEMKAGDIDTARANNNDGRWKVNWRLVDCPVGDTTLTYLYQGTHEWYIKIMVANHRVPVDKVRLKMTTESTWRNTGPWTWPIDVEITSIHGTVLIDQATGEGSAKPLSMTKYYAGVNKVQFPAYSAPAVTQAPVTKAPTSTATKSSNPTTNAATGANPTTNAATQAPTGSNLPPLPKNWPFPTTFELGHGSHPGEADGDKASKFKFRYQYITGNVNNGKNWLTWQDLSLPPGQFVVNYISESVEAGLVPVFSYYAIFETVGGEGQATNDGVKVAATMKNFFDNLKIFFQKSKGSNTVILHVEPDMWGYFEQECNDDATKGVASVSSSGHADVQGLPNTYAGIAQAIVKLRDLYAPNVLLGYHASIWGTKTDFIVSKTPLSEIPAIATTAVNYWKSLGAKWDITFCEFSDRDASYYRIVENRPTATYEDADYDRMAIFLAKFSELTNTRVVMWQIPIGNTKMRACNNVDQHYQSNQVETFLHNDDRKRINQYMSAGVVALLFGAGRGDQTTDSDSAEDGVTNPNPINGNNVNSYSADDDGGYLRERVANYYKNGASILGSPKEGSASGVASSNTFTDNFSSFPNLQGDSSAVSLQSIGIVSVIVIILALL